LRECEGNEEEGGAVQVGVREREQYVQQYELATFVRLVGVGSRGSSGIGGADCKVRWWCRLRSIGAVGEEGGVRARERERVQLLPLWCARWCVGGGEREMVMLLRCAVVA
jgi:hypothetical protein